MFSNSSPVTQEGAHSLRPARPQVGGCLASRLSLAAQPLLLTLPTALTDQSGQGQDTHDGPKEDSPANVCALHEGTTQSGTEHFTGVMNEQREAAPPSRPGSGSVGAERGWRAAALRPNPWELTTVSRWLCAAVPRPTDTPAHSAAPAGSAPACGRWSQAHLDTKPGFFTHRQALTWGSHSLSLLTLTGM